MSLINNMLKDLEKRKSTNQSLSYIALAKPVTQSHFKINKKILLGIGICLLIIGFFSTLHFYHAPQLSRLSLQPSNKSPLILTTPENENWLKPVSIMGITLQVKDNITEISFLLDHVALYRIINTNIPNEFSLIIDQAQLQSEVPAVNYLNTAIQRIVPQTIHGDTRFNIYTYPGAIIKYVNLNNENNNPELVIAIEYLTPNSNLNPNPKTASQLRATNTSTIITPTWQGSLTQQYNLALNEAANGQYINAINQLNILVRMDPKFKDARVSLAALLIDKKKLTQAKQLINEGLNLYPLHTPFIELKARILATEGNTKQALTLLETISPSLNENPDFYALLAALYEHNNNEILAIKIYKQLLLVYPNNGNLWYGLGIALEKTGQLKDAINAYNRALNQDQLESQSILDLQQHLQSLKESSNA